MLVIVCVKEFADGTDTSWVEPRVQVIVRPIRSYEAQERDTLDPSNITIEPLGLRVGEPNTT